MNDRATDEAIRWHLDLQRDDADWDGFTAWLEADPRNRELYDEVALDDQFIERHRREIAAMLPSDEVEEENEADARRPVRRWMFGGGAVAAALCAAVAVPLMQSAPEVASYATGAGQMRQIALADGSRVDLAPASRLTIAGKDQQDISIEGAALFSIVHRPARTLTVHAAGLLLRDIGTRFEVTTGGPAVRVAVAEGQLTAVLGESQAVPLAAGKRLVVNRERGTAEVRPLVSFATWRQGRLAYEDTPLSLVAADLSRYSGHSVTLDPAVAQRRFSGVLTIGNGAGLVANLAQIMDLDVQTSGKSIRLVPRRHP